jgi:hypothetical protein
MWEVLLVIVGAQGFWALVTEIWRHKQEKKKDKVKKEKKTLVQHFLKEEKKKDEGAAQA